MSGLRTRLAQLREQSGAQTNSSPKMSLREVKEALTRLQRPRTGAKRKSSETLARALGGEQVAPGLIRVEHTLRADSVHGRVTAIGPRWAQALSFFAQEANLRSPVFMDTETTGLAGGTGSLAFVLGLARIADGYLHCTQLLLSEVKGEASMLELARSFIADADCLVSFNGKSFDCPLLATRYRMGGIDDPFSALPHVDLLHVTRRAFSRLWPDCRLGTLERRMLGFVRIGDIDGAQAPEAWFDWIRRGEYTDLARVLSHNHLDLVSLSAALESLLRCYEEPLEYGAMPLIRLHSGTRADVECEGFNYLRDRRELLSVRDKLVLAGVARRRGDWALAVEVWTELARDGDPEAHVRLAKYYEHIAKDFARALKFTFSLRALEPHVHEHHKREHRLRRKLSEQARVTKDRVRVLSDI